MPDALVCHCGLPIFYDPDGWTRGLCVGCDSIRCDAPIEGQRYPCLREGTI